MPLNIFIQVFPKMLQFSYPTSLIIWALPIVRGPLEVPLLQIFFYMLQFYEHLHNQIQLLITDS